MEEVGLMTKEVLIVDDSEFMIHMLEQILKEPEFEIVAIAKNGIEAIEKYMEFKPDLVILDINIPHVDGLEVLNRLYRYDHSARILIVSARGRTGKVAIKVIKKGARGVITKPFKPTHILKTIREVLMK